MRHVADAWHLDDAVLDAHLFYDPERHTQSAARIEKQVLTLAEKADRETFRDWREAKTWLAENAGARASCLRVVAGRDGRPRIASKPNRVASATARAGYTLVLTHAREKGRQTAEAVLHDYRARDMAEKLFDAFKTEHGQYRLRTAGDHSAQGRFFLGFISLVLRAALEERMRSADLHRTMTGANVTDELGKLKALVTRKGTRILCEASKKQRQILTALKLPMVT